ncbi:hypothetical protein K7X08_026194 [Anisodus acutangulus]|uniref:LTI65/LTI78 PGEED repeat domain-containing protein n=1 Tax=Anisodus acutangulus TaxID=402998 RepID=A0A9Q1N832_9SOLA|nr:hypothetical protein K7X08_026194 [Anisodus acutangulus]
MSAKEETKPEKGAESKSTDREVSKMKEYLAEKFKPREEDKALPEVISGKLSGPTAATHGEGSGKSMIDRVKGAASSLWIRKRGGKEATETPSTREV